MEIKCPPRGDYRRPTKRQLNPKSLRTPLRGNGASNRTDCRGPSARGGRGPPTRHTHAPLSPSAPSPATPNFHIHLITRSLSLISSSAAAPPQHKKKNSFSFFFFLSFSSPLSPSSSSSSSSSSPPSSSFSSFSSSSSSATTSASAVGCVSVWASSFFIFPFFFFLFFCFFLHARDWLISFAGNDNRMGDRSNFLSLFDSLGRWSVGRGFQRFRFDDAGDSCDGILWIWPLVVVDMGQVESILSINQSSFSDFNVPYVHRRWFDINIFNNAIQIESVGNMKANQFRGSFLSLCHRMRLNDNIITEAWQKNTKKTGNAALHCCHFFQSTFSNIDFSIKMRLINFFKNYILRKKRVPETIDGGGGCQGRNAATNKNGAKPQATNQ